MIDHEVVYLRTGLFAAGQGYIALSQVKSLDDLLFEGLDNSKHNLLLFT